jgi:4-amino-4-deoxy-L-arabinose transferase-like glycosyltransferase
MYASIFGADNEDPKGMAAPGARRLFYAALAATLILKLLFATFLPMTGDEAYFIVWGMHPAMGYYDHPPMVGWWLSALLPFGHAEWWLRMPVILLNTFIGWAVMRILRPHRGDLAYLTGTLYLIAPVNLYNVLITTDTPVILFIFLTGWAYYQALVSQAWRDYVLSGLAVGLGMLSKYFEGLIAIALGAHWLLLDRRRRSFLGLLLVAAIGAALFAQNIWWNYEHCWDNFLFNLVNRTHHGLRIDGPPVYLLTLIYLITPPILLGLYRVRSQIRARLREPLVGGFALFAGVPLLLFGLLSFKNQIGLHWLLGFYPFVFVLYGALCEAKAQRKALRFMFWFSAAHVVLLGTLLALPTPALKHIAPKFYPIVVLGSHTAAVWKAAEPYAAGRHLATRGYATAGILEYHTQRHFAVFGTGSDHGREDDSLTDFRNWNGQNVLLISTNDLPATAYAPYFEKVRKVVVNVQGAPISLILGDGFKYAQYYAKILKPIRNSYYRFPHWLPVGQCPFTQRYFGTK